MSENHPKKIALLFPHQLFPEHPIYQKGQKVFLIEEHLFFREFRFHKIKLAFHRTSMKCHETDLSNRGLEVEYIESTDPRSDIRELIKALAIESVEKISFIDPTDNWLEKRIRESCAASSIELYMYENPLFINSRDDLESFFKPGKKKFFQTTFYKEQRVKLDLLLDEQKKPLGGKWSYDADNRKKFPKSAIPPKFPELPEKKEWIKAVDYVEEHFSTNPGVVSKHFRYPVTAEETGHWLGHFLTERFKFFGHYEDAIHTDYPLLHHSLLSPLMNIGLVDPWQVIKTAVAFAGSEDVPLNSVEGFVRQVIGWREFIRGMYVCKGTYSRNSNFFEHHRPIPESFYEGTTGIVPVDLTIKSVLKLGYCHHIERLMVLGNFMLLCEFDPKAVYRWFMELFVDAYDWVMVPNVYGMSQFADGGLFATKPYISGSNYLMKMSNYPKGDWQKTWDGLFWRFMDLHRDFFLKNPRLSMLVRTFDKMPAEKRNGHLESANAYLGLLQDSRKS